MLFKTKINEILRYENLFISYTLMENNSNLINLKILDIDNILEVLQTRYTENKIYTKINQILLALNPFKKINSNEKEPHPNEMAIYCYQDMLKQHNNHSILVSGESGAGKTETTKILLKKLLSLSRKHTDLLEQIYWSNYILEAFGNAKTIRNHNSSRFGKFINIYFDKGEIIGAKIETYLLEKIRVTRKSINERNYHIFYMLFPEFEHSKFMKNNCLPDENLNDEESLFELHQAFKFFNISDELLTEIKEIIKIIILFGDFKNNSLEISELFGVSEAILLDKINNKKITVGKEIITKKLDEKQVSLKIDTLCQELYSKLFDKLVSLINNELSKHITENNKFNTISLLDIFGFEILQDNSIEQLCINYTNEILQNTFNQYFFEKEQEIYLSEGLPFNLVKFENNDLIIKDIENKVFKSINDTSKFIKSKTSQITNSLYKLKNNTILLSNLQKAKDNFEINHYADKVKYNLDEFLEKNKLNLPDDIVELINNSTKNLISSFSFKKSKNTLLESFKKQIKMLKDKISKTKVNFIRCIKPNDKMLPLKLDGTRTKEQLKYNGVIEAIRVARQGYPVRIKNETFDKIYFMIPKDKVDFVIRGKTLTFMTKNDEEKLDKIKQNILIEKAIILQANFRRYLQENKYLFIKNSIIKLQAIVRGFIQFRKYQIIRNNFKAIIIQKNWKTYCFTKKFKMIKFIVLWISFKRKQVLEYREKIENSKVTINKFIKNIKFKNGIKRFIYKCKIISGFTLIYFAKKQKIILRKEAKDIGKMKQKLLLLEKQQKEREKTKQLEIEKQKQQEIEKQRIEKQRILKEKLEKEIINQEREKLLMLNEELLTKQYYEEVKKQEIENKNKKLDEENDRLVEAIVKKDKRYMEKILAMEEQMEKMRKKIHSHQLEDKPSGCIVS